MKGLSMFSFNCKHCGRPEILHFPREQLEEYDADGLWPDKEYQEDTPMAKGEGSLEDMFALAEGFEVKLLDCPEFTYQEEDKKEILAFFARVSGEKPWVEESLPREWLPDFEQVLKDSL